jgi:microcystin-dependent protein
MDEYLAVVKLFAGNFAPQGWMFCHGQVLSINSNQALFALIGTTYGGNGRDTFALPDLRGRVAVGFGQGNGLSNVNLGQQGGAESVATPQVQVQAGTGTAVAGAQPHENRQPYLGLNYIICVQGIFPPRS